MSRLAISGLSSFKAIIILLVKQNEPNGGAVIAGLPYGTASTVSQAFDRMRGHGLPSASVLHDKLKSASGYGGPWPTVSVWHGTSDRTVDDANAQAIVDQWKFVHKVTEPASDMVAGHEHHVWKDSSDRDAIELYRISGMGHGAPLDVQGAYGEGGPYMLDSGISSTEIIARSWGLTPSFARRKSQEKSSEAAASQNVGDVGDYVRTTIENALRTAGLMK